ncbi:Hypothetical predicted protein [Cloeon dipterum]|uniref:Uncharacterized protein n=1 Tax=Cloeon dipterum TaxID=197152 RepID=A0A8S1CN75_9INSE|nr:Hypothetical predicted protein [Cloeon dipterum]
MELLRYLSILFTTASLISPISTDLRNNIHPYNSGLYTVTIETDQYFSTEIITYHYEKDAKLKEMDMKKSVVHVPEFSSKIVQLPFDFKIFGLNIREVKVMRKGGIRSANPNLQWSAIPLRIKKFDKFTPCQIRYSSEGALLTIQWEFGYHNCKNRLKLSFQLKIQDNGLIYFFYKEIPFGNLKNARFLNIDNNFGGNYKYKVPGTNDTFTLGPQLKIHETDIKDNTLIMVQPLPLCANFHERSSCLNDARYLSPPLECFWCPAIGICSSKKDFLKKVWNDNGCEPRNSSRPVKYFLEDLNQHIDMFFQGLVLGILVTCYLIISSAVIYLLRPKPARAKQTAVPSDILISLRSPNEVDALHKRLNLSGNI